MTDPFDALRRPDAPIAPDAAFARRLRQRLAADLAPLLDATTAAVSTTSARKPTMTITPYISVRNAVAALDFYRDAFGAVETQRLVGDDGRIGHAELEIGGSRLMLADEYPEVDAVGPQTRGGPTCVFHIEVSDVDAAHGRALSAGATSLRGPADQFHGSRSATIQDPFGHRWVLSRLIETLTTDEYARRAAEVDDGHGSFTLAVASTADATSDPSATHPQAKHLEPGDLYYFTIPVADVSRAQRFFGTVLGWRFAGPDQGHIENISAPPGAVALQPDDTGPRLWFVVDDIHAAVDRVRTSGGTADEPVEYPSGWSSDCVDDQGTRFSLSVPTPEYTI